MLRQLRLAVCFFSLVFSLLLLSGCGLGLCSELGDCASGPRAILSLSGTADFGTRTFSSTANSTFTLRNSGDAPATAITPIGIGSSFEYEGGIFPGTGGTCASELDIGGSCTLVLRFTSDVPAGVHAATFSIQYHTGWAIDVAALAIQGTSENGTFSTLSAFNADTNIIRPLPSPSTKLYVTGSFTTYKGTAASYLARLNGDGSFDPTFVNGGFDNMLRPVTLADDGSGDIYVGGDFANYAGSSRNFMTRINSDGSIDNGFAVGTGFNNTVFDIAIAPDGSGDVYVTGYFTSYNGTPVNHIVRLNADGTIDAGFGIGTGFDADTFRVVPLKDGSGDLYVVGLFGDYNGTTRNGIIRINSDGTVDTGFAPSSGLSGGGECIALARDGSGDIYVGGFSTGYNGNSADRLVRINSDGSYDAAFDTSPGFDNGVYGLAVADDGTGDIYVTGTFTTYAGVAAAGGVVRLNSDGTRDLGFAPANLNGYASPVALAEDGSQDVYVGGGFNTIGATGAQYLARLQSTGVVD